MYVLVYRYTSRSRNLAVSARGQRCPGGFSFGADFAPKLQTTTILRRNYMRTLPPGYVTAVVMVCGACTWKYFENNCSAAAAACRRCCCF